jgi:hypothetical protein
MGLIPKPSVGNFCSALRAVSLLTFGFCIVMSGCRSSETIWSAESKSPDGQMIASARAVARNKGLSIISGVDTSVSLSWATGSKHPTSIFELADASDAPIDTKVEMNWLTPTHLQLTYRGNQSIVFQAVKFAGVDISVREPSSAATNTAPSSSP